MALEWAKVDETTFQLWTADGDMGMVVAVAVRVQRPYPTRMGSLKMETMWDWDWYVYPEDGELPSRKVRGTVPTLLMAKEMAEYAYEMVREKIKVKRIKIERRDA